MNSTNAAKCISSSVEFAINGAKSNSNYTKGMAKNEEKQKKKILKTKSLQNTTQIVMQAAECDGKEEKRPIPIPFICKRTLSIATETNTHEHTKAIYTPTHTHAHPNALAFKYSH